MNSTAHKLIYVVDDEQVIARTLAVILDRAGYRTHFFSSAEDCSEACAREKPALVVCDVVLTGMNGLEFACRMRTYTPEVPCILFSGQAQTSELIEQYPCEGKRLRVLSKPIQPVVLLNEVRRLLEPDTAEAGESAHGTRAEQTTAA